MTEQQPPMVHAQPLHNRISDSQVHQGGPSGGLVSEGNPVRCHKIDYEIKGSEMQLVEIELDPTETVIGEAGAMMFMEDGIKFEAKFGDGADPKQGFFKSKQNTGKLRTYGRTKLQADIYKYLAADITFVNVSVVGSLLFS